jgi:L-lactate dehydrogenase complex protein LldG
MEAREEMLGRLRAGLRDVPPGEAPGDVPVPREYLTASTATRAELVALFTERVTDYKAAVRQVVAEELPEAIAEACAAQGARRMVIPPGLPAEWLTPGVEWLRDEGLTHTQLDESDGVLTACALAIAQTGTILLNSGPGQGRRALTLLPDYHLCVVRAEQIVGIVPEAVRALALSVTEGRRPITFISGPSATSDIELSRVEGVHGPRRLEVLIVGPPGGEGGATTGRANG